MPDIHPNTAFQPEALVAAVTDRYHLLAPVECTLIRNGFNDHYHVTTRDGEYVLRLYLNRKYYISSEDDFRFELELLRFTKEHGAPVVAALPDRDGSLLSVLQDGDLRRCCALFPFIHGERPRKLELEHTDRLGIALGLFHREADRFVSSLPRYQFDLEYLLYQPLAQIEWTLREHDLPFTTADPIALDTLLRPILDLPRSAPIFGIIHGDPHGGNVFVTPGGDMQLFDFDHCGYGWRAYDVATAVGGREKEMVAAFVVGYRTVQPLSEAEL